MAGRNGTLSVAGEQDAPVGALDLEDVAYERVPVRVTILGTRYVFDGWVRGPGCPARINAEVARLRRRYGESLGTNGGAYDEFRTDVLRAIFDAPADQYELIDLLAGDPVRFERIFRHLKWWIESPAEASTKDDDDPEAPGGAGASTTPSSSPISSAATAERVRTVAAG
jgi:hypothetical protein